MFAKNKLQIAGYSLLELLLSMTLSLSILILSAQLLRHCYQQYISHIQLSHRLSTARMIATLILNEVHNAGFLGCVSWKNTGNVLALTAYPSRAGMNGFTITHASLKESRLLAQDALHKKLIATTDLFFAPDEIGIISDCKKAEIFRVKIVNNLSHDQQKIFLEKPLFHHFDANAYVGKLERNSYFLTELTAPNKSGNHVLYVEDIYGNKKGLFDELENFNVYFDVMIDGQVTEKTSSDVKDWSRVVGMRVNFKLNQDTDFWNVYAALRNV